MGVVGVVKDDNPFSMSLLETKLPDPPATCHQALDLGSLARPG
jgi:hypothetical protein